MPPPPPPQQYCEPLPPPPVQQQPVFYEAQPVATVQQTTVFSGVNPPPPVYTETTAVLPPIGQAYLPAPTLPSNPTFIVEDPIIPPDPAPFYMSPSKLTQPPMVMVPSGASRPSVTVQPNGGQPFGMFGNPNLPKMTETGPALISAAFNPGQSFNTKAVISNNPANVVLRYGGGAYIREGPYFG